MPELYLTPASISYLTQLLLTFLITVYLLGGVIRRGKKIALRPDRFLLVVFISLTLLSLLFFLEYSFLPDERLYAIFVENSVLRYGNAL